MQRDALFAALDSYLEVERFTDYCVNGIQVEGKPTVTRVAFGVSISHALLDQAIAWDADALIVHHGIFWKRDPEALRGFRRQRLKTVLEADLTVAGYHLPLDAHPKVGNNACIARALGLVEVAPFGRAGGVAIGVLGSLPAPVPASEVVRQLATLVDGMPLAFLDGRALVRQIAVVSGGGGGWLEEAASRHADMFITGEPEEPSMAIAAELGVHFVAAGHYRTETFGVRALADYVAETFGLQTKVFEIANPV